MIDFGQILDTPADFVLEVHTEQGNGDGARAFRAVDELIKALANLVGVLAQWIVVDIQTNAVLENVRAHSVMALLRYSFEDMGDENRRSMVAYLNGGTAKVVNWLNVLGDAESPPLANVVQRIEALAGEMDLTANGRFEPLRSLPLLRAAVRINQARKALLAGDRALLLSNGSQIALDGGQVVTTAAIEAAAAVWKMDNHGLEMLLVVESPDYTQIGKWIFLHDGCTIDATVDDSVWLGLFRSRKIEVRPGDVMRVVAATEALYDQEGQLICKRHVIKTVSEIVQLGQQIAG